MYICKHCGAIINTGDYYNGIQAVREAKEQQLCEKCKFWFDIYTKYKQDPNLEIIDNHAYLFLPNKKSTSTRKYRFAMKQNHSVVKSNNILELGYVPEPFREILPNTAIFISYTTYRKLNYANFSCERIGCWDRYHCLHYNISKEKKPWNQIPSNHKPGDEKCESFINKYQL